ncbi:flavin reductase family protein [Rhodococcus fascians]|nr:flavin reductase family protein [Rhodococcus fascians]MBY4238711.1 flavin reductase family protein [Rhodococcus fascians]MBY4254700.1 flavin reductase family protein [Rhodococcus fascians]MBY4270066.1 flavin reductase family protein [Rhodococcus fascians]
MTTSTARLDPTDSRTFRRVLGTFPTGVVAVTANTADDGPVGMVIGSFTSISIDPPLVAFSPSKTSTSWPKINGSRHFAVSILGEDQHAVCAAIAEKSSDMLRQAAPRDGDRSNAPLVEGALAWIECEVGAIHDAGDHWIVVARVLAFDTGPADKPLIFFKGAYSQISTCRRVE